MAKKATTAASAATKISFVASEVEERRLDDLKPYPRNSHVHSAEQVDALAAMIREFGFTQPMLVDEKGVILAGHARRLAATKLGMIDVPVVVRRGLTPAQKRAIVIADNQVGKMATWDTDLLKLELGELKRLEYDLALTGFDDASLVSYLAGPKQVDPPQQFQAFDESIPTEHECPKCRYRWSGSSSPAAAKNPDASKKKK